LVVPVCSRPFEDRYVGCNGSSCRNRNSDAACYSSYAPADLPQTAALEKQQPGPLPGISVPTLCWFQPNGLLRAVLRPDLRLPSSRLAQLRRECRSAEKPQRRRRALAVKGLHESVRSRFETRDKGSFAFPQKQCRLPQCRPGSQEQHFL